MLFASKSLHVSICVNGHGPHKLAILQYGAAPAASGIFSMKIP